MLIVATMKQRKAKVRKRRLVFCFVGCLLALLAVAVDDDLGGGGGFFLSLWLVDPEDVGGVDIGRIVCCWTTTACIRVERSLDGG